MKVLGNKILVKVEEENNKSASGLYVPDNADKNCLEAEAIEVGPGSTERPMSVSVGDKLIITKLGGIVVNIENEEYKVIDINDVLVVL